MKFFFTLIFFISNSTLLIAQNLITLERNGASTFYNTLDDAVNAAQTGDKVYIPGGAYTLNTPIGTGLHLIGVGYNPDSTIATEFTKITNDVTINNGADNGSLTGIYFLGGIKFRDQTNHQINNYTISRCRLSGQVFDNGIYFSLLLSYLSQNIFIYENVFDSPVSGGGISSVVFSKNIFSGLVGSAYSGDFQKATFNNNIFLVDGLTLSCIINSQFSNNIFLTRSSFSNSYTYGNVFSNNIFIVPAFTLPGTDINSLFNIAQSSIFINQSGNSYDPHQNYHLKTASQGKNYGTDATDLGVYGTASPWKEGGLPFNPHIQYQSISTTTNQGVINVNIKVMAQKN